VTRSMTQSPSPPVLRLGTRGSRLALAQAEIVRAALAAEAGVACELVVLKTSGDRILDRSLADLGGKGLFTKELEEALLGDKIDLAVHSMKDVPVGLPSDLGIGAVLPREDVRDAFLSRAAPSMAELPEGSRIGTSSVRRAAQIARLRSDLEIMPLRGNVDTRLTKLDSGAFDAMILAYAGLKRLELQHRATCVLSADEWLPALSQGAIGIEIRQTDDYVARAVAKVNDRATEIAIGCERAFQTALGGSCHSSIAGLATFAQGKLAFHGEVLAPDGSDFVDISFEADLTTHALAESVAAGHAAGEALKPRVRAWLEP